MNRFQQVTKEEFFAEIDTLSKEMMAMRPKAEPTRRSLNLFPVYNNQYEYLHSHELETAEAENGATYSVAKWRYKERVQMDVEERMMALEYAD